MLWRLLPVAALCLVAAMAAPAAGLPFDTHTRSTFADRADLERFCRLPSGAIQCKFVVSPWGKGARVHFMSPNFYSYHDEWFWFRLVNGQPVGGAATRPLRSTRYATVPAVRQAMHALKRLPLKLTWIEERLYAPEFYALAMKQCGKVRKPSCERQLGVGTLLRRDAIDPRAGAEQAWLFELEPLDQVKTAHVRAFQTALRGALPSDVRDRLGWLARPVPWQQDLLHRLRKSGAWPWPLALYQELVKPGHVAGYTTGITAGTLRRLLATEVAGSAASPTDIVIIEGLPERVPPVAGIITTLPQTPQAHLNLLAAGRGTPNAWAADFAQDREIRSLASTQQPVVLEVQPHGLRWRMLRPEEWENWLDRTQPPIIMTSRPPGRRLPLTVDLARATTATTAKAGIIGGKALGMHRLLQVPGIHTPPGVLAITPRLHDLHLGRLARDITDAQAWPTWIANRRFRFLMSEGEAAFRKAHAHDREAMAWLAERLKVGIPKSMRRLLKAGGIRRAVQRRPLPKRLMRRLRARLQRHFAFLAPGQGLRLRSSSTIEDLAAWNGAGLYTSATGWLDPKAVRKPKRTLERALRRVLGSYWAFRAIEERELAAMDHMTGAMGLLVHPRFDNNRETANAVILGHLTPTPAGHWLRMRVDAQPGAISVTNPPAEATRTLERVHVDLPPGGPARIQRQPATGQVFSDSELTRMAHDTAAIARQVLDATRSRRPTASRPHAITIDIELKRVAKGWPALADGRQLPARLIYKQVRPLSRPPLLPPWELGDIRVPDEILAWAEKLVVWQCIGGGLNLRAHILHIAGAAPLLLPSERRFVARVETAFSGPLLAGQGLPAKGQRLDHWQLPLPRLSANGGLDLNLAPGQHGVRLQIDGQGRWGLRRDGLAVAEGAARCVTVTKVASNSEWLRRLLDRPR